MVIVDTTVWIDYFHQVENRETLWLERQMRLQRFGLTDLNLCEILQGIRDEGAYAETRSELSRFQVFETGGIDMALAAANNYRILRRRGITVRKTIDCWIATFCLEAGHSLLHRDRDFDPFEVLLGMKVVHA